MANYDRQAFEDVCERLDRGEQLTFEGIGDIFGKAFWIPLVYSLMDSADAARAIQNAIHALRAQAVQEQETAVQVKEASDGASAE